MANDIGAVVDVKDDVVNVFGNADAYFEVVVTSTFGSIDLIDGAQNFDGEASDRAQQRQTAANKSDMKPATKTNKTLLFGEAKDRNNNPRGPQKPSHSFKVV